MDHHRDEIIALFDVSRFAIFRSGSFSGVDLVLELPQLGHWPFATTIKLYCMAKHGIETDRIAVRSRQQTGEVRQVGVLPACLFGAIRSLAGPLCNDRAKLRQIQARQCREALRFRALITQHPKRFAMLVTSPFFRSQRIQDGFGAQNVLQLPGSVFNSFFSLRGDHTISLVLVLRERLGMNMFASHQMFQEQSLQRDLLLRPCESKLGSRET